MIEIDGSFGSGGGQVLRTALAFSTLTNIPFRMINIRSKRNQPGLKQQHLSCIRLLKEMSDCKVLGDTLGSSEIMFIPGEYKSKNIEFDIQTAGSITLLLQSILLPALFSSKKHKITITGGTDVAWSCPSEYTKEILFPHLRRFCNNLDISVKKKGFYPKGEGVIELKIDPSFDITAFDSFEKFKKTINTLIKPFNLVKKFNLLAISGSAFSSKNLLDKQVSKRMANAARKKLLKLCHATNIRSEYVSSLSTGAGIVLWAKGSFKDEFIPENPIIFGADELGEKGILAEKIGESATNKLIKELNSGACVDINLADNLIPFMALLNKSKIKTSRISDHILTNIAITEKFLGKMFAIDKDKNIIKRI